jgi:hypothetical protein
MEHGRYIRASDIGTFLYCKRAWHLSQQGAASQLETERAKGTAFHVQHGQNVQAAGRAGTLARWCGIAALVLLALWLLTVAR